jgi:hypothetical protein
VTVSKKVRASRALRVATVAVLGGATALMGAWWGMHHVVGFAPALVDALRGVIGQRAVAWLEDRAYSLEDNVKQKLHGSSAPVTLWDEAPPLAHDVNFPPPPIAAPFSAVAHPADGRWSAVPGMPTSLARTLVHPDPARSYSALAVVALDLRRVAVRSEPGTEEPISTALPRSERHGLVEASDLARLLAAWDGGFKTMHGHFGMMARKVVLLPPLAASCTVAFFPNDQIRIATWKALASSESKMLGFRQGPPCLIENGVINPAVDAAHGTEWGSAVDGATIIRRSAMGIDERGETLFVGIGESVSTRALADGMRAAGVRAAVEMDVNYAYVRFLLYGDPNARPSGVRPRATALMPKLLFTPDEYVDQPSLRDFFYAVTKQ